MRLLCKFILILIFSSMIFPEEPYAILEKGPYLKKGISFLGPNVIEYYYAVYSIKNNSIEIYCTKEKIVVYSEWEISKCIPNHSFKFTFNGSEIIFVRTDEAFFFFLKRNTEFEPCIFIKKFLERFQYFSKSSQGKIEEAFPAVLFF